MLPTHNDLMLQQHTILEANEYAQEMIHLQTAVQPTALFIQKMNVSSAYSNIIMFCCVPLLSLKY